MKKNEWTERRLQHLFGHYNRRFWRGRLPTVQLHIRKLDDSYGHIEWKRREIAIDVGSHMNDRHIRATLLHEMAHLATARKKGHGSEFWSQIEHLLRQKAPIAVDSPETPGLSILQDVVPRRFPLARRMVNRAENQRQRKVMKEARGLRTINIGKRKIIQSFEDAASIENLTWRQALIAVGIENGLVDVDGKPVNRWAAEVIAEGKGAHARSRRDHLSYEKRRRELEAAGVLEKE